jgi:hypothetical protein
MRYDLVVIASREVGIPYAVASDGELATPEMTGLASLVPAIFAVRHNVIPLHLEGDVLSIAMASPTDILTLRRLRQITRCQIQPFVATRAQIRRAIASFYRP